MIAEPGNGVTATAGDAALGDEQAPRSGTARIVGLTAKAVALGMAAFQLYTAITVSFSPTLGWASTRLTVMFVSGVKSVLACRA